MQPDSPASNQVTGKQIGKYQVVRVLGEGSSSTVYLCYDPFSDRQVAVKLVKTALLHDQEQGELYRKLFISEAALAGKLNHPHLAAIYDAVVDEQSQDEHSRFIVMEYVAGGTLEVHAKPNNLLPLHTVIELIFKCSRALDFAYKRGITHRDIKPANLLLVRDPNHPQQILDIKITDFGAALNNTATITQIRGIGSPAYMSPEQLSDDPLNQQTDIYSLGVVMYQLLTGHLPYEADNHGAMMYQILHVPPAPPTTHRQDLPDAIEAVVMRALAKNRADRYADWESFSMDLADLIRRRAELSPTADSLADAEKFNHLRHLRFFAGFTDVALWEVVRFSEWARHPKQTVLLREGEPGNFFYVIAQGEVSVTRKGKLLNLVTAGECVGEMAYLGNATHKAHSTASLRSADVTALKDLLTIRIEVAALHAASVTCQHSFDRAFIQILLERLQLANQRITG